MSVEIITHEDLHNFKMELLGEIQKLLSESKTSNQRKWLRSKEVLELLKISPGTLQNYRIKGILKCSRFGRTIYYAIDDIEKVLQQKTTLLKPHN